MFTETWGFLQIQFINVKDFGYGVPKIAAFENRSAAYSRYVITGGAPHNPEKLQTFRRKLCGFKKFTRFAGRQSLNLSRKRA
ncbi:hypothetical protein A8A54_03820 [Brucella pseudogrignonensis]|nr:hypothetical protein A8A54_03820 [Brucella pseudogrignonensis]